MPQGSVDLPTGNTPPTTGIGLDPFGNPAKPGEYWSPDFGRWDPTGKDTTDKYGTTPGSYWNQAGPGGSTRHSRGWF